MSFIGIICDKNEEKLLKIIAKFLKDKNHTILGIHNENIENIKNVKFQTILITNDLLKEFENVNILKNMLENTSQVIMNADIDENLQILENLEISVITYGFNQKSTVISSSVTDEELLLCLQRSILDINGKEIEAQEININLQKYKFDNNIYVTMGLLITLLIYDEIKTYQKN